MLDFDTMPGGVTRLVVSGRAPRNVRRAFAELEVSVILQLSDLHIGAVDRRSRG